MKIVLSVAAAALFMPAVALADPCEADVTAFQAGDTFRGIVRYVGDGDGLCVGQSSNPATWVEVRLADFNAPELSTPNGPLAKDMLTRTAKGQAISCTAVPGRRGTVVSHDRVIAACTVRGQALGDLLRQAGSPEGGN